MRLSVSFLNLAALGLLATWIYQNGTPDWTTQAGAIVIGATFISALNLVYLVFARRSHFPKTGYSVGYAKALAAIAEARKTSLNRLRQSTVDILYETASPLGSISAESLIEAASLLTRKGEYDKAMQALADAPLAHEIMYLAGEGHASGNDDVLIRLEGLVSFIHAREPQENGFEPMETVDVRLDALYQDAIFDLAPDDQGTRSPSHQNPNMDSRQIDYEDVVNATLRIVPIEKITGLALHQRRALFSRVRGIMESTGSLPDASQVDEIRAWVSENSR